MLASECAKSHWLHFFIFSTVHFDKSPQTKHMIKDFSHIGNFGLLDFSSLCVFKYVLKLVASEQSYTGHLLDFPHCSALCVFK